MKRAKYKSPRRYNDKGLRSGRRGEIYLSNYTRVIKNLATDKTVVSMVLVVDILPTTRGGGGGVEEEES